MNRLKAEKSAYLRHAADQAIDWYSWSEEPFEKARQEDKAVFLSTGAIWCHWCHVMAKECFDNKEIARTLNEHFINVKLDRDERPDIDRRYQQAVIAMGGNGGWPLSVFLTPDKKPFYGGTYFPPEDSHGRPGFKKVLLTVADFYASKRSEVLEYGERLTEYLKPAPSSMKDVDESLLEKAETYFVSEFDLRHGGFGTMPKFPMPGAMEFLMNRFFFSRKETLGIEVKKTLESMAKGGFHDQLKGGFHRYSTDEAWIIPHFEKMADDNAWLLKNYIHAYAFFKDEYFRTVAEGIITFVKDVLSDPGGGFYASQDADVTPDDEGGYFTWTDEEFRRVLDDREFKILSLHYFHDRGRMPHEESKRVLAVAMDPEEIAEKTGMTADEVMAVIMSGRQKLLAEREKRETPFIDRTFYTSLNGIFITAFLTAYRITGDKWVKEFALRSLDRILQLHFKNGELYHCEEVKAVLEDYVYLIESLICAYEISAEVSYLETADEMMEICLDKFGDRESGGFFDTETKVLGIRLKGVEDIPHPSANSVGILQLLRLYHMVDKERYYEFAENSLKVFAGNAQDMGVHAGYYFCALDAYFHMLLLTVEASPTSELAQTAFAFFHPYKCLVYAGDKGRVTPCLISGACFEPLSGAKKLQEFLEGLIRD
jgi:uncharacterized protein YyaL (SSP411 family)